MSADRPPGPRGRPVLGCLPDFGADPLGTLLAGWLEFGDVVRFRGPVPKADMYLVVHPEHVDHVLSLEHLQYPHTASFDARCGAAAGHGIITAEGEEWAEQRAALEPVLGPERVRALTPTVAVAAAAALDDALAGLDQDAVVDLYALMGGVSVQMLGTCLFGAGWHEHGETLSRSLEVFVAHVGHKLSSPVNVPERVPNRRNRRFLAAKAEYDRAVAAIVADRRRQGPGDRDADVLGAFLEAQEKLGREGDDRWLRDQLTNHLAAGHATVRATLAWSCHLLGLHPEVQADVRAEARAVLVSEVPTVEELNGLERTRMVLWESMRLYPPLSVQPRSPISDDTIDDCRIPGGASLFISSYLTHRHPEVWDEPEAFRPERFADGPAAFPPGAYWPFSHGPRRCIGDGLAMVEMTAALGLLLRRRRIVLHPRMPVQPELGIGLVPGGGVPARLEPL